MTKGTPSSGRHNREGNHIRCRRCGRHSYHVKKGVCSACGFGRMSRLRDYHWCTKSRPSYGNKSHNRRTQAREKWRTGNQNNMTKTAVEKR